MRAEGTEVRIEDREETDTLSLSVDTGSFGASWTVKEHPTFGWQAIVATEGGSGSHGPFESRDHAVQYILAKADILTDVDPLELTTDTEDTDA